MLYFRLWGKSFGRIKFAGVESSPVFRGYMDGGVRAAERAAKEVGCNFRFWRVAISSSITKTPFKE